MSRKPIDYRKRLGARIRSLREERALTQTELGDLCGISQRHVSVIERGERAPGFDTLISLAHDGLGVKLTALFTGLD